MTVQNYLVIEDNVVTNIVVWDGDISTWQPPENATMLIQSETQAMVWDAVVVDFILTDWQLVETTGAGDIGFTWDGTILTTNQPKPVI